MYCYICVYTSCNAEISADSNDTESDVFQTTPTLQAVLRWTQVEGHTRQLLLQGLCWTMCAS